MVKEADIAGAGLSRWEANAGCDLSQLSDTQLLASTRHVVGRSNQLLALLLAHLAEVEARGIHRTRACSTLCAYCIYELRLSEDQASRRVAAARLVRKFPALVDVVANGELHLTGLLMLGPYLTHDNFVDVLARAQFRTKRELARLVRELDPLPDVPARIEPLGPAPGRNPTSHPSWQDVMWALYPVRNLPAGERPSDWASCDVEPGCGVEWEDAAVSATPPRNAASAVSVTPQSDAASTVATPESDAESGKEAASAPVRNESARVGAQRYLVQFTASEGYVHLVERAKALLSNGDPRLDLAEIHLRAMHAFVEGLERRRFGAPRQRGRHVPAAVRREVFERDGARCTFVDNTGQRCRETHLLEIHHCEAFARGGQHTAANLTIHCKAHNSLAAEAVFGREHIEGNKSG